MKRVAIVVLMLCCASAAAAADILFDHGNGALTCGDRTGVGGCATKAGDGEALTIAFARSAPELLDRTVTITRRHAALREKVKSILFPTGITPEAPEGTKGGTVVKNVSTIDHSYRTVENAARAISDDISAGGMIGFRDHKIILREAVAALAQFAGGYDKVPDALKNVANLERPIGDISTWWANVRALNDVSDEPAPLQPETTIVDDDLEITIAFTSKNPLVKVPQPMKITVLLSSGWILSTSTGFAASRLVDDHYTVRTVVDTPTTGTTPAVTHREAVAEERDAATPEATYFVHLRNVSDPNGFWRALPRELSFGVGLATGVKGRLYLGASYALGSAGAFTVGIAGGNVKRLSRNVNVKNLGDVDPEATRRDVFTAGPFVALSWRFGD
jgi:hypothetical protein